MLGAMGCDGDRMFVTCDRIFVTCDRMFVKEWFGDAKARLAKARLVPSRCVPSRCVLGT